MNRANYSQKRRETQRQRKASQSKIETLNHISSHVQHQNPRTSMHRSQRTIQLQQPS